MVSEKQLFNRMHGQSITDYESQNFVILPLSGWRIETYVLDQYSKWCSHRKLMALGGQLNKQICNKKDVYQ